MSDEGSGMTAIVAIIAIIVILGLGYLVFQNFVANDNSGETINIDLPGGDGQ